MIIKKLKTSDKSEKGRKKKKNLKPVSNILAGVTMGTSGSSITLSAAQISKANKIYKK